MLRNLVLAMLAGWLAFAGPAQAQATADQLNKLSLESLTAPSAGGGGYRPTARRSSASRASSYSRHRSYRAGSYRQAYRRPVYRGRSYRRPFHAYRSYNRRAYRYQPHRSVRHYSARRH